MPKQISYKRFLKLLSKSPRKWYLQDGAIRIKRTTRSTVQCPVTFVGEQRGLRWKKTDRVPSNARTIVAAADWRWAEACIRRDLLKACGLVEDK